MTKKIDPVRAYLAAIGRKGGQSRSQKKQDAARRNILNRWAKKRREEAEASAAVDPVDGVVAG